MISAMTKAYAAFLGPLLGLLVAGRFLELTARHIISALPRLFHGARHRVVNLPRQPSGPYLAPPVAGGAAALVDSHSGTAPISDAPARVTERMPCQANCVRLLGIQAQELRPTPAFRRAGETRYSSVRLPSLSDSASI